MLAAGQGVSGRGNGTGKLHPSPALRQVIEESEQQLCKAKGCKEDGGDARIPHLQTFTLGDAQRERFKASLVNRNSDACQEETLLPTALGEQQPPQWDFLPATAPKASQAHRAAICSNPHLGAPQHGSHDVPRARLVLCEHPAAGGTERMLQGQGNVSDWFPVGTRSIFPTLMSLLFSILLSTSAHQG